MSDSICSWRDHREAADKMAYASFSSYTHKKYRRSKSPSEFSSTSSDTTSSSSSEFRRRRRHKKRSSPPQIFSEEEFPSLVSQHSRVVSHPTLKSLEKTEDIDENTLAVLEIFQQTLNDYVSNGMNGKPFVLWAH